MGQLKLSGKKDGGLASIFNLPIFKKLKGIKNIEVIIACVLGAVILLVYFSSFTSTGGSNVVELEYSSSTSYAEELELRLSTTLSAIAGAGNVRVMLTLESGPELVIATSSDQKTTISQSGDNKSENITVIEDPIIVTQNGTSSPLVLMEILPTVKGVVVVASGADDVRVKLDLLNAIQALLDVDNSDIKIFVGN
jgi:stage III sporulation protein AG